MITSIVSYPERGVGGNNKYRGNCTPKLLQDLFEYYKPADVYDPCCGSNTTGDVTRQMGIKYRCSDLNPKYGGIDIVNDEIPYLGSSCIFWHPPYHDIIQYSGNMYGVPDVRDLSRCPTYEDFIKKYNQAQAKLYYSLKKGGRLIVLIGDIKRKGVLYSIQQDAARIGTREQIIIKEQHNCVSDRRSYSGNFIPIVHEYVLVFKKEDMYVFSYQQTKSMNADIRNSDKVSWRDIVYATIEQLGGKADLESIYREIDGHERTKANKYWKEKIRQVLQSFKEFKHVSKGVYAMSCTAA